MSHNQYPKIFAFCKYDLGETKLDFWSTGKRAKQIWSVGWKNKNII